MHGRLDSDQTGERHRTPTRWAHERNAGTGGPGGLLKCLPDRGRQVDRQVRGVPSREGNPGRHLGYEQRGLSAAE